MKGRRNHNSVNKEENSDASTSIATTMPDAGVLLSVQPNKPLVKQDSRKISEESESDFSEDEEDKDDAEFTVVGPEKDYKLTFVKEGREFGRRDLKKTIMTSSIPVEKINFKSTDDMRNKYLSKLAYQQVWLAPMHQPKA